MIAIDTNVLVYAHRRESRVGESAHALMVGLAEGDRLWGDPVAVLLRIPERRDEPMHLEG